eukprot:5192553-Amphidinium_carterae.1
MHGFRDHGACVCACAMANAVLVMSSFGFNLTFSRFHDFDELVPVSSLKDRDLAWFVRTCNLGNFQSKSMTHGTGCCGNYVESCWLRDASQARLVN